MSSQLTMSGLRTRVVRGSNDPAIDSRILTQQLRRQFTSFVPQAPSLPGLSSGQAHRMQIGEVSHPVKAITSTPLEPFWPVMASSDQDCFEPDAQLRY
jgi:hypothetical protein